MGLLDDREMVRLPTYKQAKKYCEDLLNSENTEGVSDALHKSGVLHDVGESHASVQTDNDSLASGELPLEKITNSEKVCEYDIFCKRKNGITYEGNRNRKCRDSHLKES